MTHEWKKGDRAMVVIETVFPNRQEVFIGCQGDVRTIPERFLFPIPPAMTPEAQTVLARAVSWHRRGRPRLDILNTDLESQELDTAVADFIASSKPADPVEALLHAVMKMPGAATRFGPEIEAVQKMLEEKELGNG